MSVTLDDVKRVAALARLGFSPDEEQRLIGELNSILEYMAKLSQLDTDEVIPTSHGVPLDTAMRKDEARSFDALDDLLSQGPDMKDNYFRVPRIIE